MIYNIENTLEFSKIKEIWEIFALTEAAKKKIQETVPILSESRLLAKQKETTEARLILEKGGNPPLVTLSGITDLLMIAKQEGCLSGEQLELIGSALVAVKRLKNYLNDCKQFEMSLPYYEENLNELEEIREQIQLQIRAGKVLDNASKELKSLRINITKLEDKIKTKAESILRQNKKYMSDDFCTLRNNRICLPVKKEYKAKVSGSVIDKSSSGNTFFVEPAVISAMYDELQGLKIDEENEERRILYVLTGFVADAEEEMKENVRTIEKLDFIFSKGKLSQRLNGIEPLINVNRRIVLKDARHPLMDAETCVPLQFEIGNETQGVVITGPNTGGKTVAIKTVALICMMAQCGLHVPCSKAEVCMNSNYLCDIGDGQSLSENLSTFSAHITNVLEILSCANEESLVIMDELGSGTDPQEGMGIAIAIIEELRKSGALFLVTTHYPEVKDYADRKEGIINARMAFDKDSLQPLYQLIIGEAGESCAFYIAQRLGMSEEMLETASEAAYGGKLRENNRLQSENEGRTQISQPKWKQGKGNSGGFSKKSKKMIPRVQKKQQITGKQERADEFQIGDSVMVYPEKKIGIVCERANDKGELRIQLPTGKVWLNHKRIKLHVKASQLYPENYDFSIIFDTVEERKMRHQMERKFVEGKMIVREDT